MKNIFLKPFKPLLVQVSGILLFFVGIGLEVLKYIKTYPIYFAIVLLIYYFGLVYMEWNNQREQKKQKEEHEKETLRLKEEYDKALKVKQEELEKIKQQYITKSDFNPSNIAQIMDLIDSKFEKNKWYPQGDLWKEIYNITFTKYNHDYKKQIMHGLAERDLIKIKDVYGQFHFMSKK
ncbi:hypothetical protein MLOOGBEN_06580 [Bacillus sp. EB106-08-02-XG196]|uniref:hypothetical protein n=1 Tax=Bacillus sp. EB106-08-02-XG196 TaxID=2737049 RepID=UPI0015C44089|nr:hypothetical protein [Bacillus sp. EB106-08-02-XG196]NWQ40363.1 hypothetical protein [Bacillus sp. EB106-08-02-XG196]